MKDINRRQFLKIGGSSLIGVAFAGVVGNHLWNMFNNPEGLFYGNKKNGNNIGRDEDVDFQSPYRRTLGFEVPDEIIALETTGDKILIASQNIVYIYNISGQLVDNFPVPGDARDIAFYNNNIYMLYASRIVVYDMSGDIQKEWSACSDNSDYCSFTVFEGGVFATDASNKNICQYNLDGSLARFINSPDGFVVPSYSFGITNSNGLVYCSNPGHHRVEVYDKNGQYLCHFGESGNGAGQFCGCCNPVHVTPNGIGEIITSEKGIPRISCYTSDGKFRSVLLNEKMLGGGKVAYDVRVCNDKLIVANGKKVQVFQYNSKLARNTMCGNCDVNCAMKTLL